MIQAPTTYADWAGVIDMLEQKIRDDEVLSAMQQGSIAWQSGVAERFSQRLVGAINARMNKATDKFQSDMNKARGQESLIVQALLSLRKEMAFLAKAINLPALPESDRTQYVQLVRAQADSIQDSLEDSAKKDRSGKLASIVRNHKVNAF